MYQKRIRSHISDLSFHLMKLKNKQSKHKESRGNETITIRMEPMKLKREKQ